MAKIRVVIVEDSITVRKRLAEILSSDPLIDVVGEAGDGREGVRLCEELRPDVVTLDMQLPEMSGLAATKHIMASCPTPIVVVSAAVNRGELFTTYDALAAGAIDVVEKMSGDDTDVGWERAFLATVRIASRIKVVTRSRARRDAQDGPAATPSVGGAPASSRPHSLVAIGASTGGPAAVVQVLRGLPRDFPLSILLVLHIGAPFAASLTEWLDRESPIPVRYAVEGEPIPAIGSARVLMAPPDRHVTVHDERIRILQTPERNFCRPSVDTLFDSLAKAPNSRALACLLTGMGKDGASGLLAIRRAGGTTFAQDEQSSVVYGMPREAVLLGAAQRVLPLGEMAGALVRAAAQDAGLRRSS